MEPELGSRSCNKEVLIPVASAGQEWSAKKVVDLAD